MSSPFARLSFRVWLAATMLPVVVGPLGLFGVVSLSNSRRAADELSHAVLRQSLLHVDAAAREFLLTPVRHDLLQRHVLPRDRPVAAADLPDLFSRLAPSFEVHTELSYLGVALEKDGEYWVLKRKPDGAVVVRRYVPREDELAELAVRDGDPTLRLLTRAPWDGFDARARPFYVQAKEAGRGVWTDTYVFRDDERGDVPGVTYATPVFHDGKLVAVLDSDYDLRALSSFFDALSQDVPGTLFVAEERRDGSRRLIAGAKGSGLPAESFRALEEKVAEQFLARPGAGFEAPVGSWGDGTALAVDDRAYLAGHLILRGDEMPRWLIVLVMPESPATGGLRRNHHWLVAAFALAWAAAVLAALALSGRLSRPLRRLEARARNLAAGKPDAVPRVGGPRELARLAEAFNDMAASLGAQRGVLLGLNAELEGRVAERTARLEDANKELQAFCYSVSHDLRAPLRAIDGFSKALLEDFDDRLDDDGRDYLRRVRTASQRMGELIDDLLALSRVARDEMTRGPVDLSALAGRVADGLRAAHPGRAVEVVLEPGLRADGDADLLRVALENLLGNAWKYTGRHATARIEFGSLPHGGGKAYYVRDDGAGFDPAYADKLFQPFQRLHRPDEFEGHGIGLATVQRVVHRHGGRVWAEGAVERGATFFFTLGESRS